ncbi:D-cysteine desulfhydrase 2, mitochondrial [Cornus florida]|uniref:D-cysteine desulfhydrase 2, mitochondrial n=1 Tax=Cornus florida TaxID=4283 RepID=UPI00289EC676|nr:D-cysteine desulfhydrase 2, mitochondrial [Cornus florida]
MKLQNLPRNSAIAALKNEFHSGQYPNSLQGVSGVKLCGKDFIAKLLDRRWTLPQPDAKIHQVMVSDMQIQHGGGPFGNLSFINNTHPSLGDSIVENSNQCRPSFYVVRDDLLHPLVNGNKARKLDGLFPLIEDHSVTDVVTCGGCQSAHAAAVAVSCAEKGLTSHLLLRGEQPEIPTGYNLISMLYGNVTYVPRSLYAKREEMIARHANLLAGSSDSVIRLSDIFEASFTVPTSGKSDCERINAHRHAENSKKVVIVNEGAGDAVGLLGVIRLVQYLSQNHLLGKEQALKFVVDAGTGTTAVGLGLGSICLGLPWEVTAVMLADSIDGYRKQEERLVSDFRRCCAFPLVDEVLSRVNGGVVHWVERSCPRKFGNVLTGEVKACQQIAQQTGVPVDPVYTLAAWELATQLGLEAAKGGAAVVMLHTGGTLGMFGLAQRYKSYFHTLKNKER